MTRIDAHHHLWPADVISRQPWRPPDDAVLRRAFESGEFESALDLSAIDGSIVMQSVDAFDENDRLAAYAAGSDRILGWVGYADLPDADAGARHVRDLAAMRTAAGGDKLVGVRCLVGADPMAWTADPAGRRVLEAVADASLVWDVVPITAQQVDAVVQVARALPALRIVVDHLASPPVGGDGAAEWQARLERLAACPNVAIKLSVGVAVLQNWSAWDPEALTPFVRAAVQAFGPGRSMLASNWPVVLLRASHEQAWRDVVGALDHLDAESRARIEGGTAGEWYRVGA